MAYGPSVTGLWQIFIDVNIPDEFRGNVPFPQVNIWSRQVSLYDGGQLHPMPLGLWMSSHKNPKEGISSSAAIESNTRYTLQCFINKLFYTLEFFHFQVIPDHGQLASMCLAVCWGFPVASNVWGNKEIHMSQCLSCPQNNALIRDLSFEVRAWQCPSLAGPILRVVDKGGKIESHRQ